MLSKATQIKKLSNNWQYLFIAFIFLLLLSGIDFMTWGDDAMAKSREGGI